MADQPLSGKATIGTLTDDDRLVAIDAPGTTAATRLIVATNVRTYMQNGVELSANKGAANGYAPLDATSKVPAANLPTLASGVASYNTRTGAVVATTGDITGLMTGATGALPLARIISTDGHTTANTIYVGVNDPTS